MIYSELSLYFSLLVNLNHSLSLLSNKTYKDQMVFTLNMLSDQPLQNIV